MSSMSNFGNIAFEPAQSRTESGLGRVVVIANLPGQATLQTFDADRLSGVSRRHPDHD